ncbi:hypothetical protein OG524_27885 [Streptomyces sp. NBC_01520]|uniref:hypothetical protein n=1 Tax=Streptomyces sp. NBC_01520 TaxID=2903892 RepID=UPI003864C50B
MRYSFSVAEPLVRSGPMGLAYTCWPAGELAIAGPWWAGSPVLAVEIRATLREGGRWSGGFPNCEAYPNERPRSGCPGG